MTTPTADQPTADPTEPDQPTDPTEPDQQADDVEPDSEGEDRSSDPVKASLRREAGRYRRELRGVEAERDSLQSRLTSMQRIEVERIATQGDRDALARADDLWLAGTDLADLLDEDGQVDAEKVRGAVAAITAARPHWRRTEPVNFDGGVRAAPTATASWAKALRGP